MTRYFSTTRLRSKKEHQLSLTDGATAAAFGYPGSTIYFGFNYD